MGYHRKVFVGTSLIYIYIYYACIYLFVSWPTLYPKFDPQAHKNLHGTTANVWCLGKFGLRRHWRRTMIHSTSRFVSRRNASVCCRNALLNPPRAWDKFDQMMPENISKKIKTCHASLSNRSFEATSSVQCAGMIRVLPLAGSGRSPPQVQGFNSVSWSLHACSFRPKNQVNISAHSISVWDQGSNGLRVVSVGGRGNCSWS